MSTSDLTLSELKGITSYTTYSNGQLRECRINEENIIRTSYGDFIPHYSRPDIRTKDVKSLSFHQNGKIHSIYLEKQSLVRTPSGIFSAELITFHEDGSLDSVFPLNGQIGFGWSEEDERELAQDYTIELLQGKITVKINGIRFFPDGKLRNIIFWSDETILLSTPIGEFPVRRGVRFYENGQIYSFEPAIPINLKTPIGDILSYDVSAALVESDFNSVVFDREGRLFRVKTSGDIIVSNPRIGRMRISSRRRLEWSEDVMVMTPLTVTFNGDTVTINNGEESWSWLLCESEFLILPDIDVTLGLGCGVKCNCCNSCCGTGRDFFSGQQGRIL
ncbi:MAG: hypothetical protein LBC20_07590 [Planctomycetaceae bacterium]|jgi:hypothetical protein|nr:hypothetical protein [Planctomycetaceae bacterium]